MVVVVLFLLNSPPHSLRYSDLYSQGLGLHGFGLLQSCIRIHPGTAPQVHISGTVPFLPSGHPVAIGSAALFGALGLLHAPDGVVLPPSPVLEGLSLYPEPACLSSREIASCGFSPTTEEGWIRSG